MFYSQCLLSKKGPLGTIWFAAHCHKRLKKHQVSQTNISSSVDKILVYEAPVVTYRILGFLLLGVVRIYSKKVEYLFHDCRQVLTKINDSTAKKKPKLRMETMCAPYSSITLPDRFELDAFDLEILEDVRGGNVRPSEEIMLEDSRKNEGIGHLTLDKYHYEEGSAQFETCTIAYTPVEDVRSPHLMGNDIMVNLSNDLSDFEASMEKLRGRRFSEEFLQPMILGEANEEPNLVGSFGEEPKTGEDQIKFLNEETLPGPGKEPPDLMRSFDDEQPLEPEMTSPEGREHQILMKDRVDPITVNVAPETKPLEASGATTPEFMLVRTPATKERPRLSKKRKCCFDEIPVLPNQVLKQQIDYSGDLVCKRRKAPHTTLRAWKAGLISNLPRSFLEPLNSGLSSELKSLFFKPNIKPSKRSETVETPESVDVLATPNVHAFPDQSAASPSPVTEAPENVEVLGSETIHEAPDQTDIAPSTPITRSTPLRFPEVPEITNSDRVGPESSFESIQKQLYRGDDHELDFSLLNEEINSREGDQDETDDGWSVRTRAIARYLCKKFLDGKKRRRWNEGVNLLQLLRGKTRKESARTFYEILVLKTEGCIDVNQDEAYGDIHVVETSKLKQFYQTADFVYGS